MSLRMLIDTTQPEETRVVVHSGDRIEDFDHETDAKKQLKGNIYLAKVTRVEPSLQAAFVEYGGNRHGFLPFSEIHPDYYRIPISDREKLMEAEEAALRAEKESEEAEVETLSQESDVAISADAVAPASQEDQGNNGTENGDNDRDGDTNGASVREIVSEETVDSLGGDDDEETERRRAKLLRTYKIQEVIKRRQILLIQVTKEERGNKGAALTTYLSLAGRYCVLMPNTNKGGGISRKISNANDRRRLKNVLSELDIPQGIAVIVRTAGSQRSKAEIRRDYEYLMRLWNEIRATTFSSTAPALIYEEANLIKRAIRDLYSRDMEEVLVAGEDGYRAAKDFMKSLMPSHAKKVQLYKDTDLPLFQRFQVEKNLDAMHSPIVHLRSGGYIVLNTTEALVAIDVNSGKATRERNIEETALRTNTEAAEEIGRQLRLRDLAGLVVIDFIDMEEHRNNREVERRLKEALRHDRARIQLGRISAFGLLEMSRQRLRPSLFESTNVLCPHCQGTGHIRTTESSALQVLRLIGEEAQSRSQGTISATVPTEVALYLLNQKRAQVIEIEQRHGITIEIFADPHLSTYDIRIDHDGEKIALPSQQGIETPLEAGEDSSRRRGRGRRRKRSDSDHQADSETPEVEIKEQKAEAPGETEDSTSDEDGEKPRKRRRRGKRGGRRRGRREDGMEDSREAHLAGDGRAQPDGEPQIADGAQQPGYATVSGAANGSGAQNQDFAAAEQPPISETSSAPQEISQPVASALTNPETVSSETRSEVTASKPTGRTPRRRTGTRKKVVPEQAAEPSQTSNSGGDDAQSSATPPIEAAPAVEEKPKRRRRTASTKIAKDAVESAGVKAEGAEVAEAPSEKPKPTRKPRQRKAAATPEGGGTVAPISTTAPRPEAVAASQPTQSSPQPAQTADVAPRVEEPAVSSAPIAAKPVEESNQPKRRGWWNRIIS